MAPRAQSRRGIKELEREARDLKEANTLLRGRAPVAADRVNVVECSARRPSPAARAAGLGQGCHVPSFLESDGSDINGR